jgi:hypothetical protein
MSQERNELILASVRVTKRFLHSLSVRNVTGDFRGADNLARAVANRRDGQGNIDSAALLGDAHRVEMLDPITPDNACKNFSLLVSSFLRNDEGYWLADGLML